jgi:hypothetical protein
VRVCLIKDRAFFFFALAFEGIFSKIFFFFSSQPFVLVEKTDGRTECVG